MNDLPYLRQYKKQEFQGSFKKFKKEALLKQESGEKKEEQKEGKFRNLDSLKQEIIDKREAFKNLK